MTSIIVSGYMIRHPVAGNMLAFAHYLAGLSKLGYSVSYIEHSGWPDACYHPQKQIYSDDPAYGISAAEKMLAGFGVSIPLYYVKDDNKVVSNCCDGRETASAESLFASTELYLNLGGVCSLPEAKWAGKRVLVDMDPLFTQAGRFAADNIAEHDVYFSYGCNIGNGHCDIPTLDLSWIATVPPVVPEFWQNTLKRDAETIKTGRFTTVANWSAYGGIEYQGKNYGQKDVEFRRFQTLPGQTEATLEIAASGIDNNTTEEFCSQGWRISDAAQLSTDVERYRQYIINSVGEFSVAKNAYVATHSGWFSDRSICYLAAGRPVVVQDTGISEWLPVGTGVLTFETETEAVTALSDVRHNYDTHCLAAKEIAHQYFDYKPVLTRLVERSIG